MDIIAWAFGTMALLYNCDSDKIRLWIRQSNADTWNQARQNPPRKHCYDRRGYCRSDWRVCLPRIFDNNISSKIRRHSISGSRAYYELQKKLRLRKLHELAKLYGVPCIQKVAKARRMRWAGHFARLPDNNSAKMAFASNPVQADVKHSERIGLIRCNRIWRVGQKRSCRDIVSIFNKDLSNKLM